MLRAYSRQLFVGTLGSLATVAIVALACSSAPRKPAGTGGGGSTGTGGATATGGSTGTGGDTTAAGGSTGTGGDTTATGGSTGAGGDTTATGGSTAAGGSTGGATGTGGTTGTGGDTTATGGTGGTTTPPVDNVPVQQLPVAITDHWYPGGWSGDAYTASMFAMNVPWTIVDQTGAATGPCSMRVAGALGKCYKFTYTPLVNPDGTPTNAAISFLNDVGGVPVTDPTAVPRVAQGAMRIAGQVAGAAGGESVLFNLGSPPPDPSFYQFTGLTLTTAWQKIEISLAGVTYDHWVSPFGFSSASTTAVTFYVDDLRFDATAAATQ